MAWLVVALAAAFVAYGGFSYGYSSEVRERVWTDLIARPGGPMTFRFILQPTMAAIAAIHHGIQDARLGRSPYFWTVLSHPTKSAGRLREGLFATSRIILLGIAMDAIYQYRVLKTFYPVEALLIAFFLAVIPYFLIRGPACRIARRYVTRSSSNATAAAKE